MFRVDFVKLEVLWTNEIIGNNNAKYDAVQCCKDEWDKLELSNSSLIKNLRSKNLGFNLPRRIWTTLNYGLSIMHRSWKRYLILYARGITPNPGRYCGAPKQNIDHFTRECLKRKFGGKLEGNFNATSEAIEWLKSLDIMFYSFPTDIPGFGPSTPRHCTLQCSISFFDSNIYVYNSRKIFESINIQIIFLEVILQSSYILHW